MTSFKSESLVYRQTISSQETKNTLIESITWDLEAIKRTAMSVERLSEMNDTELLDLNYESGDYQSCLFDLYAKAAKLKELLGQMELYCNSEISNSYTANYFKKSLNVPGVQGIWLRLNGTAILIKDLINTENNVAIDLYSHLNTDEAVALANLNASLSGLVNLRNDTKPKIDAAIKYAEQYYLAAQMTERISINYDAVTDIGHSLNSSKSPVNLNTIEALPSAIHFQDAYTNPRKYLNEETEITISGNNQVVSLILRPGNKIFMGFGGENMIGLDDKEKPIILGKIRDAFIDQVLSNGNMNEMQIENLRRDTSQVLSQSFCNSVKVTATKNMVVVTPNGFDQSHIGKLVALKMLEHIKVEKPDTYSIVNDQCEAISLCHGVVDPRVALALAFESDNSAETVFSDYPISDNIRDQIKLYQSLSSEDKDKSYQQYGMGMN